MELTKRITQDGREEFYDIIPPDHKAYCKECVCHNVIGGKVVCRSDKLCNVKHEISIREKKSKEEDEKKPKVIIYSRVSTEKQTLEQQERTVNEWLKDHNMTATQEVSDEGVSGGVTYKDRNLGKIVLPMLKKGDTIIVSEVSRIGRSMSDINKFVNDELKPRGVRLVIVQMGIDLDCAHLRAIDEMLLFAFSFSAQMEKELIQERTQSALDVRKKKLEEDGQFISSKSGKVVTKLGRPKKSDLSAARTAAAERRKKEAAEKPCNKAIWAIVRQCTNNFTELTKNNFSQASYTLQQMGIMSSTGKVLTLERVRNAYYNLRTVYEDRVNLRRDSADYRIMREKGMSDSDIKQYYKDLNNNINNNNQDIDRKEEE